MFDSTNILLVNKQIKYICVPIYNVVQKKGEKYPLFFYIVLYIFLIINLWKLTTRWTQSFFFFNCVNMNMNILKLIFNVNVNDFNFCERSEYLLRYLLIILNIVLRFTTNRGIFLIKICPSVQNERVTCSKYIILSAKKIFFFLKKGLIFKNPTYKCNILKTYF